MPEPSSWPVRVGAALRRARLDAGLSQVALALDLRVSPLTVRRAEKGRVNARADLIERWEARCKTQITPTMQVAA